METEELEKLRSEYNEVIDERNLMFQKLQQKYNNKLKTIDNKIIAIYDRNLNQKVYGLTYLHRNDYVHRFFSTKEKRDNFVRENYLEEDLPYWSHTTIPVAFVQQDYFKHLDIEPCSCDRPLSVIHDRENSYKKQL